MRSWPKLETESRLPHWGHGQNDSLVLCVFLCSHGYRYGCDFVISWDTSVMQIDDEQALPGAGPGQWSCQANDAIIGFAWRTS